jgi:hypothetical protein
MNVLSERLANIRDHTDNPVIREKLGICIEQAQAMEKAINDRDPWRTTDPETSHWNGDPNTLSKLQRAVWATFKVADRPLDEYTLTDAYVRLQLDNQEWMPHIDPELQGTSLRKRRNDLEKHGIVKRLDSNGTSPVGLSIGRYILTAAGREDM